VRWTDLSYYQGDNLMPEGMGKRLIEQNRLECHALQTKMAGVSRDEEGSTKAENFMRDAMHYRLTQLSSEKRGGNFSSRCGTGCGLPIPRTTRSAVFS
jgi:hypothetical protein